MVNVQDSEKDYPWVVRIILNTNQAATATSPERLMRHLSTGSFITKDM